MNENIVRQMVASISCGSCGNRYEPDGVEILGHRNNIWFIRAECPSCHVAAYVAAVIRDERPQFYTDLTDNDMGRIGDPEPVNSDDLLCMHSFLKDFSGDVRSLFQE